MIITILNTLGGFQHSRVSFLDKIFTQPYQIHTTNNDNWNTLKWTKFFFYFLSFPECPALARSVFPNKWWKSAPKLTRVKLKNPNPSKSNVKFWNMSAKRPAPLLPNNWSNVLSLEKFWLWKSSTNLYLSPKSNTNPLPAKGKSNWLKNKTKQSLTDWKFNANLYYNLFGPKILKLFLVILNKIWQYWTSWCSFHSLKFAWFWYHPFSTGCQLDNTNCSGESSKLRHIFIKYIYPIS